jgi:hypothetical protein
MNLLFNDVNAFAGDLQHAAGEDTKMRETWQVCLYAATATCRLHQKPQRTLFFCSPTSEY